MTVYIVFEKRDPISEEERRVVMVSRDLMRAESVARIHPDWYEIEEHEVE